MVSRNDRGPRVWLARRLQASVSEGAELGTEPKARSEVRDVALRGVELECVGSQSMASSASSNGRISGGTRRAHDAPGSVLFRSSPGPVGRTTVLSSPVSLLRSIASCKPSVLSVLRVVASRVFSVASRSNGASPTGPKGVLVHALRKSKQAAVERMSKRARRRLAQLSPPRPVEAGGNSRARIVARVDFAIPPGMVATVAPARPPASMTARRTVLH
jgi:hypothetical protein